MATHEFGHALGLGDSYRDPQAGLVGVPQGTYVELDDYYVANNCYQLAMARVPQRTYVELDDYHVANSCYQLAMDSHHGVVSNNDIEIDIEIEMIVLAFSENARQNYQPDRWGNTVSKALGKGN